MNSKILLYIVQLERSLSGSRTQVCPETSFGRNHLPDLATEIRGSWDLLVNLCSEAAYCVTAWDRHEIGRGGTSLVVTIRCSLFPGFAFRFGQAGVHGCVIGLIAKEAIGLGRELDGGSYGEPFVGFDEDGFASR